MIDLGVIRQVAGYLEGEGSFTFRDNGSIAISATTTDYDVAQWLASILDAGLYLQNSKGSFGFKQKYQVRLYGASAIGWMLTLYYFLGIRRRKQISDTILFWKSRPIGNRYKGTVNSIKGKP